MAIDQLALRLATVEDLPDVAQVVGAAYAKYLTRMDRPPAPMTRDLRPQVQARRVWVGGRPISTVVCLVAEGDGLLVENVAVLPEEQGKGRGRQLMAFAEVEARRRGLTRLRLYTNEVMTENIAFYGHLGFREVERRTSDGYRRVFMEKVLA